MTRTATADAADAADAAEARRRGGCLVGCLPPLAGLMLGVLTVEAATEVIGRSWSYCMDLSWVPAIETADSPRFGLIGTFPLFLLLDCCCFPVGFWLAWRFLPAPRRGVRAVAGCLAGILLLGAAFTADLMLNVGPKQGMYVHARCPGGRPPWWPAWLPLDTSRSPVDFRDQP
ncbi:hypothetical protein [Peterkaempfera griseoplana]|uniref:hypothetical protein n=1 Tax=Peterkaempfera griseoplana TaxID=66896 RepID=UPI0006E1FA6F|nr:hypothetical protein [Peterkaempfera griseoplana]